jgi:hypothetical protein
MTFNRDVAQYLVPVLLTEQDVRSHAFHCGCHGDQQPEIIFTMVLHGARTSRLPTHEVNIL